MDIEEIRQLYTRGPLRLRYVPHATVEARKDGLVRSHFLEALLDGEMIEDYGQSALLLYFTEEAHLPYHVVIDYFPDAMTLVFITTYIPSSDLWEKGWKKRKRKSTRKG